MKDDAVIKDNEAVYLLNEQTYLHLRENHAGVGYEVFDKNSPLQVEEGQIPWEALGNTQRRIETARAYYLVYSGVSFSTNEMPGIKIPGTALSEFSSDLPLHSAAYLHIVPCSS